MFVIFTGRLVSGETFLFPCYLETLRCIKNCVISFNLNVDFKKPFLPFLGKAFPRTYLASKIGAITTQTTFETVCVTDLLRACEQALLFERVRRVPRERTSERRSREARGRGKENLQRSLIKFHLYFAQTKGNTIGWKMTFRKSKLIDNRPSWHPLRLCVRFGSQGDQIAG